MKMLQEVKTMRKKRPRERVRKKVASNAHRGIFDLHLGTAAAAKLTTSSSFAFIHISLLILYISSHMPSYLGQQHQQPRAYRGIARTLQSTRSGRREKQASSDQRREKSAEDIFCWQCQCWWNEKKTKKGSLCEKLFSI